MNDLRLIPLSENGRPASALPPLPEAAATVCAATADMYRALGYLPPWIAYLAVRGDDIVGSCAFKGVPRDGRAEIAYYTFQGYEGEGVATRMASQLVELARRTDPGITVTAQTLPRSNASTAILTGLGFHLAATVNDPDDGEVWEWHLEPA